MTNGLFVLGSQSRDRPECLPHQYKRKTLKSYIVFLFLFFFLLSVVRRFFDPLKKKRNGTFSSDSSNVSEVEMEM